MSAERELRPRRAPYKCQESAAEPKQTALRATQRARRAETDGCYRSHRPQLPMSTERELRPRRAPVKYYESDDDSPKRTTLRVAPRARRAEADSRYRATHRAQRLENQRRYREQHRDRIREKDRRYWANNRERILARQQRYRERHREELREKQRRYRESRREELREKRQRYRESRREAHPELVREQDRIRRARFRTKKRMEKLMTLTIPLTDCRTSVPVTEYVQAFCDSLDAGDTNVSPPESFLQLLEEDGPTRLDSGTMQGSEPSDCNDFSFLQDLLSPDEWEQVMDDVQDFDVDEWLVDMTSSDEGVDLMYDLVS